MVAVKPAALGVFGFALATAYVPWITGAASSPRWAVLVIGAIAMCCLDLWAWYGRGRITWPHIFGGLFVAWALLTLLWSPAPEAWDSAWKLLLIAALFLVGTRIEDMRPFYIGAAVGVGISSVLVMLDLAGLISYQQWNRPSGLFVNGLYLAEFAVMVIAGLWGADLYRWTLLCLPSILVVSAARGPLIAFAVAAWIKVMVRTWRDAALGLVLLVAVAPAVVMARPGSVADRFTIWGDTVRHLSWFGRGLGSFFATSPMMDSRGYGERLLHPNNDLLEIAYELGLPGVILAVAFVMSLLWVRSQAVKAPVFDTGIAGSSPAAPAKLVVIVFLVEGCFGFPFSLPWSVGLFALAAGHVARGCRIRLFQFDGS